MKNIEDATLDDVGNDVLIAVYRGMKPSYTRHPKRIIAMIKAPRGRMILFDSLYDKTATHAEAVRLFMQQHRKD